MSDQSDNEPHPMKLHGRTVVLSRGSKVYVGRSETGDGVIAFTNNEGVRTSFGLSAQALDALKMLLSDDFPRVEYRVIVDGVASVKDMNAENPSLPA